MIDRGRQPAFAEKTFAGFGRVERLAQDLESHAPAALQVLGFKHRAHPAPAQRTDDEVIPQLFARLRQSARTASGPGNAWSAPDPRPALAPGRP